MVQQQHTEQMAYFETLCETLYAVNPTAQMSQQQRLQLSEQKSKADQELKAFTESLSNLGAIRFFLLNSQSKYVQFVASSALKQLIANHWSEMQAPDVLGMKDSLLSYLANKGTSCEQQVLKMVIMLLVKIVKLAWLEFPQVRSVGADLAAFGTVGERFLLISLTAMEELIVEMGYVTRGKNLHAHRRISSNFRDNELFAILVASRDYVQRYFESVLATQAIQQIQIDKSGAQPQSANPGTNMMVENLLQALNVLEKCLNYDQTAILCNETLEETGQTNMPLTWRQVVTPPALTQTLFRILASDICSSVSNAIKVKCAQALQHLVYVRHAIFGDSEKRHAYVANIMSEVIRLMQSSSLQNCILEERQVYKEVVPILMKLQINFQVRDLLKGGNALFESYLTELFKFTKLSYASQSHSILFHSSRLNHLWQRIFLESMSLGLPIKDRLYELLKQVTEAYVDGNLTLRANTVVMATYNRAGGSSDADDEDENFEKGQRTQKQDDLEALSRLLKIQIAHSLELVLQRFTNLMSSYEVALSQNQTKAIKICESQLEYLVKVANSLFGTGLPSSSRRLQEGLTHAERLIKSNSEAGYASSKPPITIGRFDEEEIDSEEEKKEAGDQRAPWLYLDFSIMQQIINLMKVVTQLKHSANQLGGSHSPATSLQLSLVSFMSMFKNYVLTDSRMIAMGSRVSSERSQQASANDQQQAGAADDINGRGTAATVVGGHVYNENEGAYIVLAQFCGFSAMEDILAVFADKLIQNLMGARSSNHHDEQRLVKVSLDCFHVYLLHAISCRHFSKVPVVRQLATSHLSQFQILQGPHQLKELSKFFKVLTLLWVSDDFMPEFSSYMDQLVPQMNALFSQDSEQLKQSPQAKHEVMKLFAILKGIIRGLVTSRTFKLFFDWFYPQYFSAVIEGALNAFHSDDQVVKCVFKFLTELVFNRNNRLRFDTWSIDGLIVFKETAKYVVQLLNLWDSFQNKPIVKDAYAEKWVHLKQICHLFSNVLNGNYVNFAICEYYSDTIFTVTTQAILSSIVKCDSSELRTYQKVDKNVHTMLLQFIQNHQVLMFSKLEATLIKQIVHMLLQSMEDPIFEVQADSVAALNYFNEFVFEHLSMKPTLKNRSLIVQVQSFFNQNQDLWGLSLQTALTSMLFEESRNIWIFQKWCFSSIVIIMQHQDSQIIQDIIFNLLNKYEKSQDKRNQIMEQFTTLMRSTDFTSIDQRSRDAFSRRFSTLKTFVVQL